MTRKEARLHKRMTNNFKKRKIVRAITTALGCTDAYLVFLEKGDGWFDGMPSEKVEPLRKFVVEHGRKFGQLYNYGLYEMRTLGKLEGPLRAEYSRLWGSSSRYDVCFCLDKTKLERR